MSENKSSKTVGILGGSFDPVHNGHVAIAQSFLASSYITELWILLTPTPPHKQEEIQSCYEIRLQMLRAAFNNFDNVRISDIEQELPQPSYTVNTLAYLTKKHPDTSFLLCLGEDSAIHFDQWKDWEHILDYCDLIVAKRPSQGSNDINPKIAPHVHYVSHQPVDISSTQIRNYVSEGKSISTLVPNKVEGIIKNENLYK